MSREENNPKTLADISKGIRDWADKLPEEEVGSWFERPVEQMQEILRDIADKIDAAWKREKEAWEALHEVAVQMLGQTRAEADRRVEEVVKPGNAAALRDALMSIKHLFRDINLCEDTLGNEAYAIADAALAAPPRNCDLKECSTDDGMISAHEEFCESWHDDGKSCAECPYNPKSQMMTCREKWLLAPAEEGAEDEPK